MNTIRFTVFSNYYVKVIFAEDIVKARLAHDGIVGKAVGADALCVSEPNGNVLFFRPDSSAECIAHECWHVIHSMFAWAGVRDFDNEVTAYHLGYLVGKVSELQAKVLRSKIQRSKRK